MNNDTEVDQYKIILNEKKEILQQCQKEKNLESCMNCEKLFECKTRQDYVRATYDSMSKGETGGFEF